MRSVTGVLLLAVVLAVIWVPSLSLAFTLLAVLFVGVGLNEYYRMAKACDITPETWAGILGGILVAFSGHAGRVSVTSLTLYGACILIAILHLRRDERSVGGMAASLFGVVYVGWFGAHFVLLHRIPDTGRGLVMLLLTAMVLTDAGAYFVGKAVGRHKMTPVISPNKTWEGAAGGFSAALVGMICCYQLSLWTGQTTLPLWSWERYVATGALLSVAGQLGDLVESCLKRSAGVKDSGALFPGHGGVLDRCDSFLFAAPVLFYLATSF